MAVKSMSMMKVGGTDYTINDPNNAEEFSTSKAYSVGKFCYYQGNLYRFIAPHAAGAWNAAHVRLVKMGDEFNDQMTDLDGRIEPIRASLDNFVRLDVEKSVGLTNLRTLEVYESYYYASTMNIPVTKGEMYKVTCAHRGGNLAGMFYAKDGVYVEGSVDDSDYIDHVITVPDGVDTLYLNGDGIRQPVALKLTPAFDKAVEKSVGKTFGEQTFNIITPTPGNGYKAYDNNAERTSTITHQSDAGYHYIEIDVEPNDVYKATFRAIQNSMAYQIVDETGYTILSETATSSVDYEDKLIEIPSNAYKLLINYYGNIEISKKGYKITNEVNNTEYNTIESSVFVDNSVKSLAKDKYQYLWHDNFYRDDNSEGLGTNGDANFPMEYSYTGGQAILHGHGAMNSGSTKAWAYAEMNEEDVTLEFSADLTGEEVSTRGVGVVARYVDANNFYYCQQRTQYIRFGKSVSGTLTELGNVYIISAERAPEKVGFRLVGSRIDVLCNGMVMATAYDDAVHSTKHGLVFDGSAAGKITNFGVKRKAEWNEMLDAMDSGVLPWNIRTENLGQAYNFEIQDEVVNGSQTALRFENRKADNYKRSEIAIIGGKHQLDEQMFSFDMMLAEEYEVTEEVPEIIMQMHDTPDYGMENYGFEPAFSIYLKNGHYFIHTEYSPDKQSVINQDYSITNVDIGSYLDDVGNWVNWKLHIKWAYNKFFEPILEVYKDGVLVFETHEPNEVNAAQAPYFKVGIYTFNYVEHPEQCVSDKRVMYVDNIKAWY